MNGRNYLFDTNALIELFKGNQTLMQLYKQTDNVALSVISQIEYLSFPSMTKEDLLLFEDFADNSVIFDLIKKDKALIKLTSELRKKYSIRLPDALIASQAILNNYILVSSDKGFKKITELTLFDFNPQKTPFP